MILHENQTQHKCSGKWSYYNNQQSTSDLYQTTVIYIIVFIYFHTKQPLMKKTSCTLALMKMVVFIFSSYLKIKNNFFQTFLILSLVTDNSFLQCCIIFQLHLKKLPLQAQFWNESLFRKILHSRVTLFTRLTHEERLFFPKTHSWMKKDSFHKFALMKGTFSPKLTLMKRTFFTKLTHEKRCV